MVEGARLESVYRGNSIEGSNPSLSAIDSKRFSKDVSIVGQSGNELFSSLSNRPLVISFESTPLNLR